MMDGTTPTPESLLAHAGWVRDLAGALVFDPDRVDDVVQETWAAALARPRAQVHNPRAWLGGIARNVVREANRGEARRRGRETSAALDRNDRQEAAQSAADELVSRAELQARVVQAVLRLAEPYRSTLLQHYFDELSPGEIARRCGVSASTVRTRISRGLAQLRERFDDESGGDRRTWCLAMLPLSLPNGSLNAASASAGGIPMKSGIVPMSLSPIGLGAVVLAAIGVGLAAWSPWRASEPTGQHAVSANPPGAANHSPGAVAADLATAEANPPSASTRRSAPVATVEPDADRRIGGTVRDADGRPIAGARVFIGAATNPFEAPANARVDGEGDEFGVFRLDNEPSLRDTGIEGQLKLLGYAGSDEPLSGRTVRCDGNGRFEAELREPGRVFVAVGASIGVRPVEGQRRWVESPDGDVQIRATSLPASRLTVRVTDTATGRPLEEFRAVLGHAGRASLPKVATAGTAEFALEFAPQDAVDYHLLLIEPPWAAVHRALVFEPGTDLEVELEVSSGAGIRGVVNDPSGLPVEGATVCWGPLERLRNGSLSSAYDPEHVRIGAARSAADGSYHLLGDPPGELAVISAWHPDWSPWSGPAAEATSIDLTARGSLSGRLLDDSGRPRVGGTVLLGRTGRRSKTDADGRYRFEHLEAGIHWVFETPGRQFYVEVPAGERLDLEATGALEEVVVELLLDGRPFEGELSGKAIGLGSTLSIEPFQAADGGLLRIEGLEPGQRLILAAGRDLLIETVVEGPRTVVELRRADLTVHFDGRPPCLIPTATTAFERQLLVDAIARLGSSSADDRSGTVTFEHVTPGDYLLCDPDGQVLGSAVVDGPGCTVTLAARPAAPR